MARFFNPPVAPEERRFRIETARRRADEVSDLLQKPGARISRAMAEDLRNSLRQMLALIGDGTREGSDQ